MTNTDQKPKNWFLRHKILTGILVLFILGTIGSMGNKNAPSNGTAQSNNQEERKETAIKITAKDLYAKYESNEIQADDLYKDKLLEVSGSIDNIGKDILDSPYIALKTNNIIGSVQCMLMDSEKAKASELKKGASIIVEGRNNGKIVNIILNDCKIK